MKIIKEHIIRCLIVLSLFAAVNRCAAQGTAITYQGRLTSGTNAATGKYDFTFKLFNSVNAGAQVGSTLTDNSVGVTNGIFTLLLDFGSVYDGTTYWLELGVRTNGGGSFVTVLPRQQLTPTPYAISAENVSGSVSAGQIQGPLVGSTPTPLFEVDQNGTGAALYGSHTTSTGTNPGVEGITSSTDGSAVGTLGMVNSTSPGGYSTGVLGENNGAGGLGIGVTGTQSGSGWGVYGTAPNGVGVYGYSVNGTGVLADGATGISVSGFTGDGIDASAEAITGIGVKGDHSASTGTAAGVEGTTASTDSLAAGLYGLVISTNPGSSSVGVKGQNNGEGFYGIGVWGQQNGGGYGVYGAAPQGWGVYAEGATGLTAIGSTADGVDGESEATNGIGVYGRHLAITGTAAGVEGDTSSEDGSAVGVLGVVEATSPGGFSAAVMGQNNGTAGGGIGVYGSQNGTGWGVYGSAPGGLGVFGSTTTGTGVYASSSSGTGVYAYSGTGSALTVGNGAIHVAGAGVGTGTAAFIQVATTNNSYGSNLYITTLSNPLCDGDPNAILIATHQYSPPGQPFAYETHPFSVYYNGSNWTIYHDDFTSIVNESFNVLIIKN